MRRPPRESTHAPPVHRPAIRARKRGYAVSILFYSYLFNTYVFNRTTPEDLYMTLPQTVTPCYSDTRNSDCEVVKGTLHDYLSHFFHRDISSCDLCIVSCTIVSNTDPHKCHAALLPSSQCDLRQIASIPVLGLANVNHHSRESGFRQCGLRQAASRQGSQSGS